MEPIGTTEDGGYIIKMSGQEWRAFCALKDAAERGVRNDFHDPPNYARDEVQLGSWFEVLRLWVGARYRVNELQEFVERLQTTLEGEDEHKDSE